MPLLAEESSASGRSSAADQESFPARRSSITDRIHSSCVVAVARTYSDSSMTRTPERIHVDHSTISRLGHWASATACPTVDDPARTQA